MNFLSVGRSSSASTASSVAGWRAFRCTCITCFAIRWGGREREGERICLVSTETHSVLGNIVFIFDDEDHVEAGEDGWEEVYVGISLAVVPATKHRVCSGQDGAARVEGCCDPCFCNGDGLLLHGFVDRNPVRRPAPTTPTVVNPSTPGRLPHLVKLVNADHAPISEDHGPTLHDEVPRNRISHDTGCQSRRTATLPRRVHLGSHDVT